MAAEPPPDADLVAALANVPASWRRAATVSFMGQAMRAHDEGRPLVGAVWHRLACLIADVEDAERRDFAALAADAQDREKGAILGDDEDLVPEDWEVRAWWSFDDDAEPPPGFFDPEPPPGFGDSSP